MSTTAGQAGVALVEAKDYAAALPKLNTALAGSSSPAWLLARSKCHIAQASYELALRDAEAAYLSAASRGSRPLMIDAQYRRAVALFRLGRLADADACALWSMKLAEGISMRDAANLVPSPGTAWRPSRAAHLAEIKHVTARTDKAAMMEKKFGAIWNTAAALRAQVLAALERVPDGDDKARLTVALVPVERKQDEAEEDQLVREAVAEKKAAEAAQREAPKEVRADFFQSSASVSVSVFVKGVPKDAFRAEFTEDLVRFYTHHSSSIRVLADNGTLGTPQPHPRPRALVRDSPLRTDRSRPVQVYRHAQQGRAHSQEARARQMGHPPPRRRCAGRRARQGGSCASARGRGPFVVPHGRQKLGQGPGR